jgi:tRNA (guanine-N7-)-methyltransferase
MDIGLNWRDLNKPVDWEKIFENKNPVDCEIGFGNGDFLIKKSKLHPERNFFGIDYSIESYRRAKKIIEKTNIPSVKIVCLEAKAAFIVLIPEKSLSHIYLNFPDPWPKKKHYKNRLLDREFLKIAASCSTNKGKIIIATDDPFYRDFILEEMSAVHLWQSLFGKGWTNELSDHFSTKYEKKWRNEGKEIFYMMFQKKADPEISFRMREYKIPAKIKLSNFSESKLKKICGETICKQDSVSKLLKCTEQKNGYLLNVFLKDDTLIRKADLTISKSNNDKWELTIPEKLFRSRSLKNLVNKLKALDK